MQRVLRCGRGCGLGALSPSPAPGAGEGPALGRAPTRRRRRTHATAPKKGAWQLRATAGARAWSRKSSLPWLRSGESAAQRLAPLTAVTARSLQGSAPGGRRPWRASRCVRCRRMDTAALPTSATLRRWQGGSRLLTCLPRRCSGRYRAVGAAAVLSRRRVRRRVGHGRVHAGRADPGAAQGHRGRPRQGTRRVPAPGPHTSHPLSQNKRNEALRCLQSWPCCSSADGIDR